MSAHQDIGWMSHFQAIQAFIISKCIQKRCSRSVSECKEVLRSAHCPECGRAYLRRGV